jgi:peptidoglycan/LPS O-acetylase OafA/YrhL
MKSMRVFPKDFRKDIAGLRALAVMLVLLNHFQIPGFGFGFIGVDIFFVISGFLITRVLYKDFVFSSVENPGKSFLSLSSFYLRRIRRLLPAAFAVIIVVNVISYFMYNSESRNGLQTDSRWALLFLANVSFLRSQSDYFQQNDEPSMLLHYWSLSVEEQFYFIWPILFLVAASLHRMKIRGIYFRFDRRILSLILAVSILSFAFLQIGSESAPTAAYFSIFTRAWELGVGSFFGILAFHKRPEMRFSTLELFSPLFVALMISAIAINDTNWSIYVALPVLATGFFLYAGQGNLSATEESSQRFKHVQQANQFIGKISYSLYLVHWPVFVIFKHFSLLEHTLARLGLVPISIICGFFLWRFVEVPFQSVQLPKRISWDEPVFHFIKARRALIGFLSLSLVGSLYLVTYPEIPKQLTSNKIDTSGLANQIALQRFAEYEGELISGDSTGSPVPISPSETTTGEVSIDLKSLESEVISNLSNGLKINSLNDLQALKFKSLKSDINPFEKSDCGNVDTEVPRDCRVGNRSPAAKKVALVGDSKMGHFAQPLIDYYVSKNWLVVPMVMNGCHISNPSNKFMKYCVDRSKWILKSLSETKFELVVFAEWPTLGNREYLKSIQSKVDDLILLQSNPTTTSPLKCIEPTLQFEMSCQTIPREVVPVINSAYNLFRSLKSSNTHIIEAQKWICVESDCPYLTGDLFVTRDGNHMTYSYVRKITPLIFASLDSIQTW